MNQEEACTILMVSLIRFWRRRAARPLLKDGRFVDTFDTEHDPARVASRYLEAMARLRPPAPLRTRAPEPLLPRRRRVAERGRLSCDPETDYHRARHDSMRFATALFGIAASTGWWCGRSA
jgi:hypothetical protein